jgi:hypothetical protein
MLVLKGNIIKFLKAVCGVMPQAVFSSLWSGAVCTARLVLTERIGLVGQASRCGNLNQTDRKCCISRRDPAFSARRDPAFSGGSKNEFFNTICHLLTVEVYL